MIEIVDHQGRRFAEIIRADECVTRTTFFSSPESSFQFGLLAHEKGFFESPHYHQPFSREIKDLQQMFVVQRGVVAVQLYTDDGEMFNEVILRSGDAIVLIHGIHSLRVIEDMQCISVKQGPFLGSKFDKIIVETKE